MPARDRPRRIGRKELTVFLHREPHPAAFHGDAIDAGGFEDLDVVAGEPPRAIDVPCMQWQRAQQP